MNIKYYRHLIIKTSLLFSSTFFCLTSFAQEDVKGNIPDFRMAGDVALLSNYVEHGLTQTDRDPSLQAAFGFNFGPQFKLGVWGSNVNFDSTEHFLLKINAELKVQISTTTDFKLGYYDNRYFKTDTRNGNTTYLVITSHGYRIRYETNSNWEGRDKHSTYYSFGKAFELNQNWKWDNEIGYTMIQDVPDKENYFDLRTAFLYKGGSNITYQITATGTSDPSQFNGQGNVFLLVGASTSF
jgi:uncharacterized protein (TIGR02001 family)